MDLNQCKDKKKKTSRPVRTTSVEYGEILASSVCTMHHIAYVGWLLEGKSQRLLDLKTPTI